MDVSQLSSVICSTCLQSFLLSVSTPHPLFSRRSSISGGMWRFAIWHPPKSTPYSAFSWQLYSSPCLSLVDSQFSSALIFKVRLKMSAFLWNCRFLRITWLLLYDGDAQVHYPRLLLSEISSFQRPSRLKQLFLHFCHLATTSSDRWGTQHVLFA